MPALSLSKVQKTPFLIPNEVEGWQAVLQNHLCVPRLRSG